MPIFSCLVLGLTAGRGWYRDDPMARARVFLKFSTELTRQERAQLWFVAILVVVGPTALLLASIAENEGAHRGEIAGFLAVSYLLSPLVSISTAGAIEVVTIARRRMAG